MLQWKLTTSLNKHPSYSYTLYGWIFSDRPPFSFQTTELGFLINFYFNFTIVYNSEKSENPIISSHHGALSLRSFLREVNTRPLEIITSATTLVTTRIYKVDSFYIFSIRKLYTLSPLVAYTREWRTVRSGQEAWLTPLESIWTKLFLENVEFLGKCPIFRR